MSQKVFFTEQVTPKAKEYLEKNGFEVVQGTDTSKIVEEAQGCSGMLVRVAHITREVIEGIPSLKVIGRHGVGVDVVDIQAATDNGIMVVNAPYSNVNAVAEHTLTLMLACLKNLVQMDGITREGGYAKRNSFVLSELCGKTVGLAGFGKIARRVAKLLSSFDVTILAYDPYLPASVIEADGVKPVSFEELLTESDIVSLHIPLTDETRYIMDESEFGKMKKTAFLINAARGALVKESALIDALKNGKIAGAALDVFDPEPPTADNELFTFSNLIVSPHNAALTDKALLAMGMDSAEGICDCLMGRMPKYLVNKEVLEK